MTVNDTLKVASAIHIANKEGEREISLYKIAENSPIFNVFADIPISGMELDPDTDNEYIVYMEGEI